MQLSRVVPVSKAWKAAATSNQVWKPLYRLEFGPWTKAQEPDSWHEQFLTFKDCGAAHHASFCSKFESALEAVQSFRLVLTPAASSEAPAPTEFRVGPGPLQSFTIEPTSVFRTGQSVWIRFLLPLNPGTTDLRLVADCSERGEVALIVSPNFSVPAGDMQRMLMSHRTGLYAWTDTDEVQPDGQQPPSWVVAYIHYEHLLRLWPLPLPQAFETALGPSASRRIVGVQLFIDFSSIEEQACLGRLHTSLMPCQRQQTLGRCAMPAADPCVAFEAGLLSGSVTLVTPNRGDVPPSERVEALESILGGSCLVDFALLDENHRLLLGRAGVEVWNEEHEPVSDYATAFSTSWVRFLVDGVESSMRENCIQIEPANCLLRVTLCPRAAAVLRLANLFCS